MELLVSSATERNWRKLKTDRSGRLTSRANKTMSKQTILPIEYFSNPKNIEPIQNLLLKIQNNDWDCAATLYSLGYNLLIKRGIYSEKHVQSVLSEYKYGVIPQLVEYPLPVDEFDVLGLLYEGLLSEGQRNINGTYYTPHDVVKNMLADIDLSKGKTFLDPCCGSGAFFLSLRDVQPWQIVGIDKDPVAVMIAKINLLLKFYKYSFVPQIFCCDFLNETSKYPEAANRRFDYIITNPPWGAISSVDLLPREISSKETFSCFFVKAYGQLKDNGIIRFLFPKAILSTNSHKDIRTFLSKNGRFNCITLYDKSFSGVTTQYIDIEVQKTIPSSHVKIVDSQGERLLDMASLFKTDAKIISFSDNMDIKITKIIEEKGVYSLRNSAWALGVVTGDNKNTLLSVCKDNYEAIYTGKEVRPYLLTPAKNFLLFDRSQLQQAAKDEYYRAEEKLVYKFISKKLVFAYDDTGSLFLNSANILIPNIPHMSIKTVLAFLNSDVFQYYYSQTFDVIKVLKKNLEQLPFPDISEQANFDIESMTSKILSGNFKYHESVQKYIFKIYGLSNQQISHIRRAVNGTLN